MRFYNQRHRFYCRVDDYASVRFKRRIRGTWPTAQMCLVQPAFCVLGDDTRVATTNQETRRRSEDRRLPVSS
jgi:hypothetical protein